MIIGIDVDNVVCDTTFATLTQHYIDTGEKLTLDDIKTYYIENYVSDDYKDDFHLIFYKKEMWKQVKVIPHCVEVIKRLHDRGRRNLLCDKYRATKYHEESTIFTENISFLGY